MNELKESSCCLKCNTPHDIFLCFKIEGLSRKKYSYSGIKLNIFIRKSVLVLLSHHRNWNRKKTPIETSLV